MPLIIQDLINPKILIMKKSILNIGKALNREEQKQINGGGICTQQGSRCCETLPGGFELCEPGYCNWPYGCFWY